jgi:hypothetical protein
MEILASQTGPIETFHQSIHQIAGAILDKPIIFELTQRQTDRAVSFSRRMRYSRHGCLDVR